PLTAGTTHRGHHSPRAPFTALAGRSTEGGSRCVHPCLRCPGPTCRAAGGATYGAACGAACGAAWCRASGSPHSGAVTVRGGTPGLAQPLRPLTTFGDEDGEVDLDVHGELLLVGIPPLLC